MSGEIALIIFNVSVWVIPVLVAITFHEAAHGYVAWKLGDDTAYQLGRVTFNPLKHIDPVGTVVVPAMLLIATDAEFVFGWAKPVPVDFARLDSPRRDMVLVAAAGPGINLVLALASVALIHVAAILPSEAAFWIVTMLLRSVFINVMLAVFNMIPLPPLDGGRVAVGILPRALAYPLAQLERYGLIILVTLIFILPYAARELGMTFNPFGWLVAGPAVQIMDAMLALFGLSR